MSIHIANMTSQHGGDSNLKRKRSPSISQPYITPALQQKPNKTTQLSINYLARSSNEDLPLAVKDDSLPNILHLLQLYSSVLDRHESLASNLGARPLGPILIKKFERIFDAPPTVLTSHQRTGPSTDTSHHNVTWLEVIEFARAHPGQFTLSTYSEGRRVCQFYLPTKQLRVQISEEDFIFIKSGRCEDLIPPLPIWEDEEKEIATCDILETRLKELTNAADMVAARTRQLCHRLKGRRTAILDRRAEGGSATHAKAGGQQTMPATSSNTAYTNGIVVSDEAAKTATRNELLRQLEGLPQNRTSGHVVETVVQARSMSHSPRPAGIGPRELAPKPEALTMIRPPKKLSLGSSEAPPKHNFSKPLAPAQESAQPFRALCQAHMDELPRGQRVMPPCDRCRRLKMDCVKNLTSCLGCTKKHARCHWRTVSPEEIAILDKVMEGRQPIDVSISTEDDDLAGDTGDVAGDEDEDTNDDSDAHPLQSLQESHSPPIRSPPKDPRLKDRLMPMIKDPISHAARNQDPGVLRSIKSLTSSLPRAPSPGFGERAPTGSSIGGFRAMTYPMPTADD